MVRRRPIRSLLPRRAAALSDTGDGAAAQRKAALRREIRSDRDREQGPRRAERARALAGFSADLARVATRGLAGFQPTNSEPDIRRLLSLLPVAVYLPRVAGSELEWCTAGEDDLDLAHEPLRGVPRPSGPVVERGAGVADLVDVVLVPALAVDPVTGARLGYGAGFYDRLLVALPRRVLTVGVCRERDLRDVPEQRHDRPVAAVLTEKGLRPVGHPAPPTP